MSVRFAWWSLCWLGLVAVLPALAGDLPDDQLKTFDGLMNRSMAAYDAGDWKNCYTGFTTAEAAGNDRFRQSLGRYKSLQEDLTDYSDRGGTFKTLVYLATMEKGSIRLHASFVREGDAWHIDHLYFRNDEPPIVAFGVDDVKKALATAQAFVALLDGHRLTPSSDLLGPVVRVDHMVQERQKFGALQDRQLSRTTAVMPFNKPLGINIEFSSSFAGTPHAREIVGLVQRGQKWCAISYQANASAR